MSSKIVLCTALDWDTLPEAQTIHQVRQDVVIDRLQTLIGEWREVTGKQNLFEVDANLGCLLVDFGSWIGLGPDEVAYIVIGSK